MTVHLSRKQVETLLRDFPTDTDDGWSIEREDDSYLRIELQGPHVTQMHWTTRQYQRYISSDGSISRWDVDQGKLIAASVAPIEGSYGIRGGGARKYWY